MMAALPLLMLGVTGYIGSFTRYLADDYCSVYWAQHFGLLRSVWHWYITWSGRFSAYIADWFVMLMGSRSIAIVPPIMLAAWLAATIAAVRLFLRGQGREAEGWTMPIAMSVILLFAEFTLMPSIETSYYWWSGMRQYSLPLIFITLFAAIYQAGIGRLQSKPAIAAGCVFSLIFLFFNAGLSDTYAVAQLGLLGLLAAFSLLRRPRNWTSFAVLAAGAVGTAVAIVVIVAAPGNAFREAAFPAHPGVLRLVEIAGQGYGTLLQGIVTTPEKALALAGALLAAAWAGSQAKLRAAANGWQIARIIGLGLMVSFAAFLPGSWGLSEPPPDRTLSIPVFVLAVSLLLAAFLAGAKAAMAGEKRTMFAVGAVLAIVALNAAAVMGIQRTYAQRDAYSQFANKWDAVEMQIVQAKAAGADSVTVPAWPNWAGLDVLSVHAKNWVNQCTSGYYGIQVFGRAP